MSRRLPQPDAFDKPLRSRRVGAHRVPPSRSTLWVRTLWVLLATAALTAIGIVFIVIGPENVLFPQANDSSQEAETTEEQLQGESNPETTITVLNGTSVAGLGEEVEATIVDGNLGTVTFVGNAADQNATISAVFYHDPADEALAKGLGEQLGGIFYYQREEYALYETQLIVLIGSDYPGATPTPQPTPTAE